MSGRHAGTRSGLHRRFPVVLTVATLIGVWLGVDAPDISPVAPPAPVIQSAADVAPTTPAPAVPQGGGAPAAPGGGR